MSQTITEAMPGSLVQYVEQIDVMPYEDNDDPDRHTHIINAELNQHVAFPGASAKEIVDTARMTGQELIMLCGFRFIPKHNPEKYPACESCVRIAGILMNQAGE